MSAEGYPAYRIKERDNQDTQPIRDEFTQYRLNKYGGCIQIYVVQCRRCQIDIFEYQKDGSGPLLRCYVDRILTTYHGMVLSDTLICPNCWEVLSLPQSMYSKTCTIFNHTENRPAYTLL